MGAKLNKIDQQVIVITGASSGIGLVTAESAARLGAKVVLAARSHKALGEIVARIRGEGGDAIAITCDVSERRQIEELAASVIDRYGRIDTWVNNAGQGMYGRLDETDEADARRLFDINFWGVVHGSLVALPYLKKTGGALINVGSEVSDGYVPLQGMYTATKHAVKGFTDALRVEIEEIDKAPVAITLIQPTAVDTPYPQHARNYRTVEPKLPSPMIDPQKVADAILAAAQTPTRATKVGAMAKLNSTLATLVPSIADKLAAKQYDRQHYDEPPRDPQGTLYCSSETVGVVDRSHGTNGREVSE